MLPSRACSNKVSGAGFASARVIPWVVIIFVARVAVVARPVGPSRNSGKTHVGVAHDVLGKRTGLGALVVESTLGDDLIDGGKTVAWTGLVDCRHERIVEGKEADFVELSLGVLILDHVGDLSLGLGVLAEVVALGETGEVGEEVAVVLLERLQGGVDDRSKRNISDGNTMIRPVTKPANPPTPLSN